MNIRTLYEATARDNLRNNGIYPPTEARMTFDEWWGTYWTPTLGQPPVFVDAAMKEIAGKAWDAAVADERERCAWIAEGMERRLKEILYELAGLVGNPLNVTENDWFPALRNGDAAHARCLQRAWDAARRQQ